MTLQTLTHADLDDVVVADVDAVFVPDGDVFVADVDAVCVPDGDVVVADVDPRMCFSLRFPCEKWQSALDYFKTSSS